MTNRISAIRPFSAHGRPCSESESLGGADTPAAWSGLPAYLLQRYWWAYAHPIAVRVFERDWLINAILFGNYNRLRRATIEAPGPDYSGRTLQVACVYGKFTPELARRVGAAGGSLDVIDALPAQIDNQRRKAAEHPCLCATLMDSATLDFHECTFDRVVMFMLLHEQPEEWRSRTIAEAARVLKSGGPLVATDYARPDWRHPTALPASPGARPARALRARPLATAD
ncbi:MAG: rhodoquinone biosynthesis methyltransferase RquA [Xanthobacteraceae bacterium]